MRAWHSGIPLALALLLLPACTEDSDAEGEGDSGDEAPPPEDPDTVIDNAKENFPTYLELHEEVIARTCSPDDGVCHHAKEYPDLTTPQAMLGAVAAPCNIAVDDPIGVFNGCEATGDEVRFPDYGPNADFVSEIAFTELVPTTIPGEEGSDMIIHLRDAVPNAMNDPNELQSAFLWRDYGDESIELGAVYGVVSYEAGEAQVTVHVVDALNEGQVSLLVDGLRFGDPNQDGVFGADESAFAMLSAGDPDNSYLLRRLLGNVPGTPMPLANEPLSSEEMLALTCWIEGLESGEMPEVYEEIDYDNCDAAANFGQGDPESGHSLSNDVQPIFNRCTGGGCHSGDHPAAELDLSEGKARDALLQASSQDPAILLVTPGNPTDSYLVMKLRGTQLTGLQMPREDDGPADPLPEDELRVIEDWIIAGAPDD